MFLAVLLFAQTGKSASEFGNFADATAISINNAGFIYISDEGNNEIFKFDTLGNPIQSIGGYGWDVNQFDSPADVFATTLKVYIADKNNDRILLYDKDLNFISQLKSEDIQDENHSFAYPISCGVSSQGDLFILDSDNSRILKFDLNGNFLAEIGGADAGSFVLTDPLALAISTHGNLFVAEKNKIFVFDQYGNGLLKFTLNKDIANLNYSSGYLIVTLGNSVKVFSFKQSPEFVKAFTPKSTGEALKDAFVFNNKIFILTSSKILVFSFKK